MTPVLDCLTVREEDVLRLLCGGMGEREMARELGVSVFTIRAHKASARHKLRAASTPHAAAIYTAARARA